MELALNIKNLSKHYPDFTLHDVNLSLPRGYIMGFIGENGAGKSTTIKLILDLIHRDSGIIELLGKDPASHDKIGVVLDECAFPENLNAKNVSTVMRNIYATWNQTYFYNLLNRFSIQLDKTIKNYSKGMKTKLSIAVALSHDPELLILDEATSGLDPIIRDEILDVFLEFIQDESHAIFMSSHIISDLEKACDYITFIHKGKILFSQPKDELLEQYGILKCSQEDLRALPSSAVLGTRKNKFGVEALVIKNQISKNRMIDRASIEEIMLYLIKEDAQ